MFYHLSAKREARDFVRKDRHPDSALPPHQPPLCINQCFKLYHTKKVYKEVCVCKIKVKAMRLKTIFSFNVKTFIAVAVTSALFYKHTGKSVIAFYIFYYFIRQMFYTIFLKDFYYYTN